MNIRYLKEDKLLLIELTEEIDHHVTEKIRRKVDYEIERYLPRKVVFDFHSVSFMDSAGIGMLIGRYKLVSMLRRRIKYYQCKAKCFKSFKHVWSIKNYTRV